MRFVLFAIAAGLLTCGTASAERFSNSVIGLSVEKPDDWCVLSVEANAKDRRKIETDNPELREALQKDATVPLYEFARSRHLYGRITATVKVETRPAGQSEGQSGQQVLRAMLSQISQMMADVKVVKAPELVSLGGKTSGHMALIYTLKADGASFPVASEMWVIPRGNYFVVLGATYHPNDKTGERAEVMEIVNSLQLTD